MKFSVLMDCCENYALKLHFVINLGRYVNFVELKHYERKNNFKSAF